jgi:molecular chaperone DnaK
MKKSKAVGIDLGTTNSVISMLSEDNKTIISYTDGNGVKTYPSVVVYDKKTNAIRSGRLAFNRRGTTPEPIVSIKRHMGDDSFRAKIGDHMMSPDEVSAVILKDLKNSMQEYLNQLPGYEDYVVDRAIITVPAYFASNAKEATTRAGELAGLEVELTLQEPTSSALYYCHKNNIEDGIFMVYDLGGGTFDVSIVRIAGRAPDVLAIAGNNYLGGDNFDELLARHLLKALQDPSEGYDLDDLDIYNNSDDSRRFVRLKLQAEIAKKALSGLDEYYIHKDGIFSDKSGAEVNLATTVSRKDFEDLIRPTLETTLEECHRALVESEKHGVTLDMIDGVILIGGSTHIPLVKELVKKTFTDSSLKIHTKITDPLVDEPDMSVGYGAAVAAASSGVRTVGDAAQPVSSGEGDANPLVLSVMFERGSFCGINKSSVRGKLSAVSGQLPEGVIVKVVRPDGSFSNEYPVSNDGLFLLDKIPAKEEHEPYNCAFSKNGVILLETSFDASLNTLSDVSVVLSRNYGLEVSNKVTNQPEIFVLMNKGSSLPLSADYTFRTMNEYMAELKFFEESSLIKKVPIKFENKIPVGSPVTLSISCDKKSIFSAIANVAGNTVKINFEPTPQRPVGDMDIRQQMARIPEIEAKLKTIGEKLSLKTKAERLANEVRKAIDENDMVKANDKLNDINSYFDSFLKTYVSKLVPNIEVFNSLVDKCFSLNKTSDKGSDEIASQIQKLKDQGAAAYIKEDQDLLTDANDTLIKISEMLKGSAESPKLTQLERLIVICNMAVNLIKETNERDWSDNIRNDMLSDSPQDLQAVLKIMKNAQYYVEPADNERITADLISASQIARKWDERRHMVIGVSN